MRIGITGDTHGSAQAIRRILQQTPPIELWLHTGDYAADANRLHDATGIKTVRVRGNCDLLDDGSNFDEYLEIEGYKIWLTHGHRYIERNVQADLGYWAKQLGQDIVVFGHTHVPMAEYYAETLLVNPGSPSRPRGGSEPCGAYAAGGADTAGGILQGLSLRLRKFCAVSKNLLTIPQNDVDYTENILQNRVV